MTPPHDELHSFTASWTVEASSSCILQLLLRNSDGMHLLPWDQDYRPPRLEVPPPASYFPLVVFRESFLVSYRCSSSHGLHVLHPNITFTWCQFYQNIILPLFYFSVIAFFPDFIFLGFYFSQILFFLNDISPCCHLTLILFLSAISEHCIRTVYLYVYKCTVPRK